MKRVVVTGIGTINPLGNNVGMFFENLDRGMSGARMVDRMDMTHFKTKFACQIPDFDHFAILPKRYFTISFSSMMLMIITTRVHAKRSAVSR